MKNANQPTNVFLEFHGAAGEVTGSCTLLQTPRGRVVIDFGLFQGSVADERRQRVRILPLQPQNPGNS